MSAAFLLGMNAKLYIGSPVLSSTSFLGYGALTLQSNVKDLTLNLTAAEADVTSRNNSGWKAVAATLREMGIDFDMVWKPDDPGFANIKNTFLDSTKVIEMAILDQAKDISGAQGPQGFFVISSFNREEPIEGGIMVKVTAKLAAFNSWVTHP